MVLITAGDFVMGLPDGEAAEGPPHRVTLSAYCLDRVEVTAHQYEACAAAGPCVPLPGAVSWRGISSSDRIAHSRFCNSVAAGTGDHPVNCVTWEEAQAFCAARGARLPTEAEWEFAARGNDQRRYPWGNELPSAATTNACGPECAAAMRSLGVGSTLHGTNDGWPSSAPGGSFPAGASPWGVLDLAGNVWEWTADYLGPYSFGPVTDPHGPPSGTQRVYRGGGWSSNTPRALRSTNRLGMDPTDRTATVGFRCAVAPSR